VGTSGDICQQAFWEGQQDEGTHGPPGIYQLLSSHVGAVTTQSAVRNADRERLDSRAPDG